jgi:hypothetical protein
VRSILAYSLFSHFTKLWFFIALNFTFCLVYFLLQAVHPTLFHTLLGQTHRLGFTLGFCSTLPHSGASHTLPQQWSECSIRMFVLPCRDLVMVLPCTGSVLVSLCPGVVLVLLCPDVAILCLVVSLSCVHTSHSSATTAANGCVRR